MSLVEEETVEIVSDSPGPGSIIEKFNVCKLNFRVISRKACACLIIFSVVYYLSCKSPQQQQHYLKNSTVNPFKSTNISNPCCENRYECWMQCLGKEIEFTRLNRLVMPGTHHSGVYSAAFEARTSTSHNLLGLVRDDMRKRVENFLRWGIIG